MKNSQSAPIFLSWIDFHGRSAGIARDLDIRTVFVGGGQGNLLRRYARQWNATRRVLRELKPDTVLLMLPPVVALVCVRLTTLGGVRIVGDLHTGVFTDPKWRWAVGLTMRLLGVRGAAIVTNEVLASRVRSHGQTALVLHDLIDESVVDDGAPLPDGLESTLRASEKWVLVPLAYAHDEPLNEILGAAEATPEITWVLTGRAPKDFRERAPRNVLFTGFVSNEDYARLLTRCSAVAALTVEEHTMQRAGYEAISNAKALMTTPMAVLREFFEDAAIYADPTVRGLSEAARGVLADREVLEARMAAKRIERKNDQSVAVERLRSLLGS